MINKLVQRGYKVNVFQLSYNSDTAIYKRIAIYNLRTSKKKKTIVDKVLVRLMGVNPLRSVVTIVKSYFLIKEKESVFRKSKIVLLSGCLMIGGYLNSKRNNQRIIVDTHCINTDIALKMMRSKFIIGSLRLLFWFWIEYIFFKSAHRIIVISKEDRDFTLKHFRIDKNKIIVIPHSINEKLEIDNNNLVKIKHKFNRLNNLVCFVGDLGAIHNAEAAKYIIDKLSKSCSDVNFMIVGNNPNELTNRENVFFTGYVKNLDSYISASTICIAPLAYGGGVKTKVLDYLKNNKLTLSTPIGAEGINVYDYPNLVIADLNEFANKIKELLKINK
ncbi:glycosyltransferase family 4 protein [candidate division WWE3 bacterium]|nr:glycosyltransferase family 4 protein [candidate division WWE3 bacterium]